MSASLNRDKLSLLDKIQEAIGKGKSLINGMNKREAQEELSVSRKNWIINGDHQVNQRDLLPVIGITNNTYEMSDRWKSWVGTVTADATLSNNWLKVTATSTATGKMGTRQLVENYDQLQGETVTISMKIKSNNSNARLYTTDGVNIVTKTLANTDGSEQLVVITRTIDASATLFHCYAMVGTSGGGVVSITSGDYIEFTDVKLEIGDTATPFEKRSYAEVLRKCQRYYYRIDTGISECFGLGQCTATTTVRGVFTFPVTMYTPPSSLDQSGTATDYKVTDASGASVNCSAVPSLASTATSEVCGVVSFTVASGLVAGNTSQILGGTASGGYLGFEAEL